MTEPRLQTRLTEAMDADVRRINDAFAPLIEEIGAVARRVFDAVRPIYDTVQQAYRDEGAIYGDTHEGMMRWLDERSRAARLRYEADRIVEHQEMLRDFQAQMATHR